MKRNATVLRAVLLAGIAGGTAEVLWVTLYGWVTATSSTAVARQIASSFWPAAAEWAHAPALGIAIHMTLALAVAAAMVPLLLPLARLPLKNGTIVLGAVIALALIWLVNFFMVLPVVNPAFIALMPYGATLASKLLFGVAAGVAFQSALPAVARRTNKERRRI